MTYSVRQLRRPFKIINAMATRKPIIGIPADRRLLGNHWFHCVGEKYIAAIVEAAAGIPVLVPALGPELELETLLESCDGLLLTGSASNVEPHHYHGPPSAPGTWHDPERDATTLPLIPKAVAAGLPLFAVCRGFQEMNVAFGGTLHQKLQEVPGLSDHREKSTDPLDLQYAPVHEVILTPGGELQRLAGADRVRVNSLHSQGVNELGPRLVAEGRAPDGVVEAIRVDGARTFAIGVQWHPEWQVMSNDFSKALFAAFGAASRSRQLRRRSA
jgi:putative glutamine amidotransferase